MVRVISLVMSILIGDRRTTVYELKGIALDVPFKVRRAGALVLRIHSGEVVVILNKP